MKKLLILILVLGMASLANAGLIFTVNGSPQPAEITLLPSEVIELDLELAEGHTTPWYQLGYTLTSSAAEFITDFIEFPAVFDWLGRVMVDEPQYVQIAAANMLMPTPGPIVLMQNLRVHQMDSGPVDLIITVDGYTWVDGEHIPDGTILHTLHIVPEPATVLLLGLGAVMLRRKR